MIHIRNNQKQSKNRLAWLVLPLFLLAGIMVSSSVARAAVSIDPTVPNCFDTATVGGYNPVACSPIMAISLGHPLENGKCYVSTSSPGSLVSVHETDCTIISSKAADPAHCNVQTAGAPDVLEDCSKVTGTHTIFVPGSCYIVSQGNQGTTAQETDCSLEPFGSTQVDATSNAGSSSGNIFIDPQAETSKYQCGNSQVAGGTTVYTTIDLGCRGVTGNSLYANPIYDVLFAAIRFLTAGVGIVIVAVVIVAGIQYITASGEPPKQAAAKMRIINALLALLLFMFTFAIIQFLVPGGLFV